MAKRRNSIQELAMFASGAALSVCVVACEPSTLTVPAAKDTLRYVALEAQIRQLSAKVTLLEDQLLQEQRNAARARQETQEQRERIVALETQVVAPSEESSNRPPPASVATTMQAEAELRVAYRAMMRAIERLDISAEEKAVLKGSLRPTRSLDRENPWSMAKY